MPVPNKDHLFLQLSLLTIPMSHFLKVIHLCKGPAHRRCLATASPSAITLRSNTKFGRALETGPTLDDFLSGDPETIGKSERVVLGNTKRRDFKLV